MIVGLRRSLARRLEWSNSLRTSQVFGHAIQDVYARAERGQLNTALARRSHMLVGPRRSLARIGGRRQLAIPLSTAAAGRDTPPRQQNAPVREFPVDAVDQQTWRELSTCFSIV